MYNLIKGIAGLLLLIFAIIYYQVTKNYSLKYKPTARKVAAIITGLSGLNLLLVAYYHIGSPYTLLISLISITIKLLIGYFILKVVLRTAQSLADKNFLTGSNFLTGNFSWANFDWKLILFINLGLFAWTLLVFTLGSAQPNPQIFNAPKYAPQYIGVINNLLIIIFLAPLKEEIIYRFLAVNLFLHWLGKNKLGTAAAVILPALLWASLHTGILTNDLLKFIQVLPSGLAAGYLLYKKDLEHSIVCHALFNILGFFSDPFLT